MVVGALASVALGLGLLRSLGAAAAVAFALAAGGLTICVGLLVILRRRVAHRTPSRRRDRRPLGAAARAAWPAPRACSPPPPGRSPRATCSASSTPTPSATRSTKRAISSPSSPSAPSSPTRSTPSPRRSRRPDGYLVSLDDSGHVVGGVGADVVAGTEVVMPAADECRIGHRTLPCAVRRLVDGSIVAAAVPPRPSPRRWCSASASPACSWR